MERELEEAKQVQKAASSSWQHLSAASEETLSNEIRERETSELVEQLQNIQMELVRLKEQHSVQVEQMQRQLELKNTTLQALVSYHDVIVSMVTSLYRNHN